MEHGTPQGAFLDNLDSALDFVAEGIPGRSGGSAFSAVDQDVLSWLLMNGDLFPGSRGSSSLASGSSVSLGGGRDLPPLGSSLSAGPGRLGSLLSPGADAFSRSRLLEEGSVGAGVSAAASRAPLSPFQSGFPGGGVVIPPLHGTVDSPAFLQATGGVSAGSSSSNNLPPGSSRALYPSLQHLGSYGSTTSAGAPVPIQPHAVDTGASSSSSYGSYNYSKASSNSGAVGVGSSQVAFAPEVQTGTHQPSEYVAAATVPQHQQLPFQQSQLHAPGSQASQSVGGYAQETAMQGRSTRKRPASSGPGLDNSYPSDGHGVVPSGSPNVASGSTAAPGSKRTRRGTGGGAAPASSESAAAAAEVSRASRNSATSTEADAVIAAQGAQLAEQASQLSELARQVEQLRAENSALRAQVRAVSLGTGKDGDEKEQERQVQLRKIQAMVAANAPEVELRQGIVHYKDLHADFGKDRWVALRHHLRCLKALLLPNHITKMAMWSVENNDNPAVASAAASDGASPTAAAAAAGGAGKGLSGSMPTPTNGLSEAASTVSSSSSAPLSSPSPTPDGGPVGPEGIWPQLAAYCEMTPEQQQRILGLRDSVRQRRRDFADLLSMLRRLDEKITTNFQGLELQMNVLMSHLAPRQIALFLDWMERNHPLFNLLSSLSSWPQQAPSSSAAAAGGSAATSVGGNGVANGASAAAGAGKGKGKGGKAVASRQASSAALSSMVPAAAAVPNRSSARGDSRNDPSAAAAAGALGAASDSNGSPSQQPTLTLAGIHVPVAAIPALSTASSSTGNGTPTGSEESSGGGVGSLGLSIGGFSAAAGASATRQQGGAAR